MLAPATPPIMSSSAINIHLPKPKLVSSNTLMGLPDEIIIKVIGYAITSDDAINYYYDTLEQDLMQMRAKLLAPLGLTPKLLAIAVEEYCLSEFIYRTTLPTDLIDDIAKGPPQVEQARMLYYKGRAITEEVTKCAEHLRHLELLVPLEPWGAFPMGAIRRRTLAFGMLERAFPELRTLVGRLTTYRLASRPHLGQRAAQNLALLSMENSHEDFGKKMQFHIAIIVRAFRDMCHAKLKVKVVVLFQKKERDWRQWRDGPLDQPFFEINGSHDDDGIDGLVWRMMDMPSCRVTL